jgi:NADH-quinone oxidoreductase subunit C
MNPKPPATMQTTPWEDALTMRLAERFGTYVSEFSAFAGQDFLVVDNRIVHDLLLFLRDEEAFEYLVDFTAVHWPKDEQQFELVYILHSFTHNRRIRVKSRIQEGEKPQSVVSVYLTANWLEREVYDMFGIEFQAHPDLRRILMPEDWTGFPLRKDYGLQNVDQRWVQENVGIESGQ